MLLRLRQEATMKLDTAERFASPIRVSVPYDVASDLGSFKKAVGSVLGKLGCQACCSGFDIHFEMERVYEVDQALNVRGVSQISGALRASAQGPGRTFVLDAAIANDQKQLNKLIDIIGNVGGCAPCCSGHDLFFEHGRNFLINSKLEAVGFA